MTSVLNGVRFRHFLDYRVIFCESLFVFAHFSIALSVFVLLKTSDYQVAFVKMFLLLSYEIERLLAKYYHCLVFYF